MSILQQIILGWQGIDYSDVMICSYLSPSPLLNLPFCCVEVGSCEHELTDRSLTPVHVLVL